MWIDIYCPSKNLNVELSQKKNEVTITLQIDKTSEVLSLTLNYFQAKLLGKTLNSLLAGTALEDLLGKCNLGDMKVDFNQERIEL